MATAAHVELLDFSPQPADLLGECLAGLRAVPRRLPCKFFYDDLGSQLFDRICELPEYYPTRTELAIMHRHIDAIIDRLGERCLLVELGSGSSLKTRTLLDHLVQPAGYVPIDISRAHLLDAARRLAQRYPSLPIMPICADYSQPLTLPQPPGAIGQRAFYFPGSTIGNLDPAAAQRFLARLAVLGGSGSGLLIGVDLRKSESLLLPAYDDAQGVTAAFNLNLLARINCEAGGNFDLRSFAHRALWNERESRVEMHLVARRPQHVRLGEETFAFAAGESILTEYSYKHTLAGFAELASPAYRVEQVWMDEEEMFSVQYLIANG